MKRNRSAGWLVNFLSCRVSPGGWISMWIALVWAVVALLVWDDVQPGKLMAILGMPLCLVYWPEGFPTLLDPGRRDEVLFRYLLLIPNSFILGYGAAGVSGYFRRRVLRAGESREIHAGRIRLS